MQSAFPLFSRISRLLQNSCSENLQTGFRDICKGFCPETAGKKTEIPQGIIPGKINISGMQEQKNFECKEIYQ
jgi:hypothetical protein